MIITVGPPKKCDVCGRDNCMCGLPIVQWKPTPHPLEAVLERIAKALEKHSAASSGAAPLAASHVAIHVGETAAGDLNSGEAVTHKAEEAIEAMPPFVTPSTPASGQGDGRTFEHRDTPGEEERLRVLWKAWLFGHQEVDPDHVERSATASGVLYTLRAAVRPLHERIKALERVVDAARLSNHYLVVQALRDLDARKT